MIIIAMLRGGRDSESANIIAAVGHAMACEYAEVGGGGGGGGGGGVVGWKFFIYHYSHPAAAKTAILACSSNGMGSWDLGSYNWLR